MTKSYTIIPAGEVLSRLPAERRKKIEARAQELISEELALRELREAKHMTQEDVAKKLGGRQVYVSRFEKRADMKLSTLREYVGALGGELELIVSFPKGRKVKLANLGTAAHSPKSKRPNTVSPKRRVVKAVGTRSRG